MVERETADRACEECGQPASGILGARRLCVPCLPPLPPDVIARIARIIASGRPPTG